MHDNELHPIGRLRRHPRARFDAITRETLPEHMRDLVEKLRQAEPAKSPLNDMKPVRSEDR
jgi:hypothetical protein